MDIVELDRIISLLRDDNYTAELKAFRRSVQRLKIRLRNNKLSAQLKHLKTLIHRMEVGFPVRLFETLKATQPTKKFEAKLISHFSQFIRRIDEILQKAIIVYGFSQSHFKVGHLLHHYLVIRASLARLTYCFKALLVYSADLYHDLCRKCNPEHINKNRKEEENKLLTYDQVKAIVVRHECTPKLESTNDSPEIIAESTREIAHPEEQIGQLIDRKTMRPMRACKRMKN